ncbi:DNA polymerase I [Candidatus Marithrix sp. Canyon 246]|uniref:DNA polymerase I n=2 Tax=Candidatus Marithrix sp. Canyon 246 TaxID=1827136 RepID=UPI00084A0017|nr:DNA polymerase I [Candidatus Marithrix sp. Canyon 246]
MARIILIDGTNYLYRAFYALENMPNGAIYGITNMLKSLLKDYQPVYAAIVFDAKGSNFRHSLFPEYKANRSKTPDDLSAQIPDVHEMVQALGFPLLMEAGVEADDVIGTLALQAQAAGMEVLIFTGDKDFAQLVNSKITIVDTMKKTNFDVSAVIAKFGIAPELIVDYLSLVGDKVDNIPGVYKVGPKTAVKWLNAYGSLEGVIENAAKIKGKVGEYLREALPQLPLNRQLVTIKPDVVLSKSIEDLTLNPVDVEKLRQLYTALNFKKWLNQLPSVDVGWVERKRNPPIQQNGGFRCRSTHPTISTKFEFEDYLQHLNQAKIFAFNLETNIEIIGISFALQGQEAVYIPLAHDYLNAPPQLSLAALKNLLEDPNKLKIGYNFKQQAHVLASYGIELQGIAFDTMLESYVLDSTAKEDDSSAYEAIAGKGKKQLTFNQIEIDTAADYATKKLNNILQIHQELWAKLDAKLLKIYQQIEQPLISVLKRMEAYGVKIDAKLLYDYSEELAKSMHTIETQAYALAGTEFNLNSPKQLQTILFEKLNLPILKKTPKKQPSTAVEVLEELAIDYPLPKLILEYRSLSKLKSTYTDSLAQQINPKTQRVHTSYQQAVTATGRLSSIQPNLQNIPIRTAQGRKIRQAFIAPSGYSLLAADYSQIELRIMAHLSEDEKLLAAFRNNEDIHKATAAEVFEVAIEEVNFEQRRSAKAVNFGLIYGMQAFGLAKQLGIKRQEAQTYIDKYFARYPSVKNYMEQIREIAKQQGYVETIFGRRLYIPEIKSRNPQRRQYAERTAINAPMQGSAADLIKMAMVKMDKDMKMIMQVHDELVFEVAKDRVEEAKSKIIETMTTVAELLVPLVVEVGVGDNWDEAH